MRLHIRSMRSARLLLVAALACLPAVAALAQDAGYRPIEQRMPADVRRAAGVDQMTPAQLAALNAWLQQEQTRQVELARGEVREQIKEERKGFGSSLFGGGKDEEPIVSKIVGTFEGWEGATVFKLANGQRWRVIDTPPYYVPKRRASVDPAVSVSPSLMGSWRLQVEGHSVRAKVKRLD